MINANKNGLLVLDTAGKVCDYDVEIFVNVEDHTLEDALIERNIEEYTNNTVTAIGQQAFRNFFSIRKFSFGNVAQISQGAFMGCTNLKEIVLDVPTLCTLDNSNAFGGTPIENGTGYIYVRASLVEDYKVATNWSVYANQIKSIDEL